MLKGFMDHWVPTQDFFSKFWKADIETAKNCLDDLRSEIGFNNFTFYTKWYTNGIKSNLPYLYNHLEASNTKTDNEWGRQLIDYLHENGITMGAMLQFLTYEKNSWGNEMIAGEWDLREFALTDAPSIICDFTNDKFIDRVREIIREQLTLFPGIDYLFLEFEGIFRSQFANIYPRWASLNDKPDLNNVHYDEKVIDYCKRNSLQLDVLWSVEAQEMFKYYYGRCLQSVHDLLKEIDYKGTVGVVYHVFKYDVFIFADILPDKEWWLTPYVYWDMDESENNAKEIIVTRKNEAKAWFSSWKQCGYKACYIGSCMDNILTKDAQDSVTEFYNYCKSIGFDGYLGMGNPCPDIGLGWAKPESNFRVARDLYKTLYNTPVVMYLEDLSELPEISLPEGYTIADYKDGDDREYDSIITDELHWKNSTFNETMITDPAFRPERIKIIFSGETPVATASAWRRQEWGVNVGYLHNVGVIPSHRGKRLGYYASLAALHQMAKEGACSAVLETDGGNLAAVKTYLKLGFKPRYTDVAHKKMWERIYHMINNNDLT